MDRIKVKQLRVTAWIGVPDEERRRAQALEVDLELVPRVPWGDLADDVGRTVDYHAVSERVRDLAAERPRRLIETLGQEIAAALLAEYPVREVEVTVRKFVLADAGSVEVTLRRGRHSG
jgi:dihydroneopterin aldolase